jgi:hypothetical protein
VAFKILNIPNPLLSLCNVILIESNLFVNNLIIIMTTIFTIIIIFFKTFSVICCQVSSMPWQKVKTYQLYYTASLPRAYTHNLGKCIVFISEYGFYSEIDTNTATSGDITRKVQYFFLLVREVSFFLFLRLCETESLGT